MAWIKRRIATLLAAVLLIVLAPGCASGRQAEPPSTADGSAALESAVSSVPPRRESSQKEQTTHESEADRERAEGIREAPGTDPEAAQFPVQPAQSGAPAGQAEENRGDPASQHPENINAESVNGMTAIQISIGDATFAAALNDSEAAQALLDQMPFTYNMADLNSNEKFCYLSEALPVDATRPGQIYAGDVMLYGSDCLVLFYESFSSSYSYTRLGSVTDAAGLKSALGSGTVSITFSQEPADD